jgi:hypothetical protein
MKFFFLLFLLIILFFCINNGNNDKKELEELQKYCFYNENKFKNAMNYFNIYKKYYNELSNKNFNNYNYLFEKTNYYFLKSINLFYTINFEIPCYEKDFLKILNNLYINENKLLFKLSEKLNKKFYENPNIYRKEILFNNNFPYIL